MLNPQLKRGLVEVCVLSALGRGDSYGYQIIKDLSGCVEISESTLYPILRRLEASGSLTEYSVEHSGRLRKFYHITDRGREQMDSFLAGWPEIVRIYEMVKEGATYDQR